MIANSKWSLVQAYRLTKAAATLAKTNVKDEVQF